MWWLQLSQAIWWSTTRPKRSLTGLVWIGAKGSEINSFVLGKSQHRHNKPNDSISNESTGKNCNESRFHSKWEAKRHVWTRNREQLVFQVDELSLKLMKRFIDLKHHLCFSLHRYCLICWTFTTICAFNLDVTNLQFVFKTCHDLKLLWFAIFIFSDMIMLYFSPFVQLLKHFTTYYWKHTIIVWLLFLAVNRGS